MIYRCLALLLVLTLGPALTPCPGQSTWPGFVITAEGDTVSGQVRTVTWTEMPDRISTFIVSRKDGTEKSWEAKSIVQYAIAQGGRPNPQEMTLYYAKVWPHNGLRTFLEPHIAGRAQLYVVPDPEIVRMENSANQIVFDTGYKPPKADAYYVSSPGNELVIRLKPDNYVMVLKQVLKDCPELTEQIGQKKFRFGNLDRIITFYNDSCQ